MSTVGRIVGETYLAHPNRPPDIIFWVRTDKGKQLLQFPSPVAPHFFLRTRDLPTAMKYMNGRGAFKYTPLGTDEATLAEKQGESVTKVECHMPQTVADTRKVLESPYECPQCHEYEYEHRCGVHTNVKLKEDEEKPGFYSACPECKKLGHPTQDYIACKRDGVPVVDKPVVQCYEADIIFTRVAKRALGIRNKIEWLKTKDGTVKVFPFDGDVPDVQRAYYDIECDDSVQTDRYGKLPMDKSRILSISAVSSTLPEKTLTDDDEKGMLNGFWNYLHNDVDLLIGWNNEDFDDKFIEARAKLLGLMPDDRKLEFIDLYQLIAFKSEHRMSSFALPDVVSQVLVEDHRKYEHTIERLKSYKEAFDKDRTRMLSVNYSHAKATKDIDETLGLVDMRLAMADIAGVSAPDTYFYSRLIDALVLSRFHDMKPRLIARCRTNAKGQEKFKGATVIPPASGQHDIVLHFDLVSLYNRITQAFNISPELWTEARKKIELLAEPTPEDLIPLLRDLPEGIFPQEMRKLEAWRKVLKAEKKKYEGNKDSAEFKKANALDRGVKTLILAFYGQLGEPRSRWFIPLMARLVTYAGREFLEETRKKLVELGYLILYGDTDSLFCKLINPPQGYTPEVAETQGKALEKFLNSYYPTWVAERWGLPPERAKLFAIEFAEVYDTIFFGEVKKKYAGWAHGATKAEVVGFEKVRSDWCKIARDMQTELLNMRLKKVNPTEMKTYVLKIKNDLLDGKIPFKDLVISKGVKKSSKDYKALPPHVRAALQIEEAGGRVQHRVRFIITKVSKDKIKDIVALPEEELPETLPKPEIDAFAYYWTHQVWPPSKRVLWGLFKDEEFDQMKQCKGVELERFFGA